jgi:phage-related protein
MIYNGGDEYKIKFYKNPKTNKEPVRIYIESLPNKEGAKIAKYVELLRVCEGYLDEPLSKHIDGKIRELIVDFAKNHHRIFYFTFIKRNIILLHAFLKKTPQTPPREIKKAKENYYSAINNPKIYEKD